MILKVSKIFSVVFLMLNTVIFAQENAYRIEVEVNNFQQQEARQGLRRAALHRASRGYGRKGVAG